MKCPNCKKIINDNVNNGLAKLKLNNQTGAIDDFNQAIKLDPNNTKAFYSRGYAKYKLGNIEYIKLQQKETAIKYYQEAINDFNQAINLNPNNAEAYNNRDNT